MPLHKSFLSQSEGSPESVGDKQASNESFAEIDLLMHTILSEDIQNEEAAKVAIRLLNTIQDKHKELLQHLNSLRGRKHLLVQKLSDAGYEIVEKDNQLIIKKLQKAQVLTDLSQDPQTFEDAVLLNNPSSEFLHLNDSFAGYAQNAVSHLIEIYYENRLKNYLDVSNESVSKVIDDLGFASEEDMRDRIVRVIAKDIFKKYLPSECVEFSPGNVIKNIDSMLGIKDMNLEDIDQENDEHEELYNYFMQFVNDVSYDVIMDEAQRQGMEETAASKLNVTHTITPEQYAADLGMSLQDLHREIVWEVTQSFWHHQVKPSKGNNFKSMLDVKEIRHSCKGQLFIIAMKAELLEAGDDDPMVQRKVTDDMLDSSFRKIYNEQSRLRAQSKTGEKMHKELPDTEKEFINSLHVRLAGFDPDGNPIGSFDNDIQKYRLFEDSFVHWRDALENATTQKEVREAIECFTKEGGHISRLSEDTIRFIMEHGAVVFIEKEIRKDLRIILGTVSALSRTPCTCLDENAQPNEKKDWDHVYAGKFPQYDYRRLVWPPELTDQEREDIIQTAHNRLLICRSSVLPKLTAENMKSQLGTDELPAELKELDGMSLRRLGLAARGKDEIFRIAHEFGNKQLTFNIGTLKERGDAGLDMVNKPSTEHNSWMKVLTWRMHADKIHNPLLDVTMFWTAYKGVIERGLSEFERQHGLLAGKGWPIERIKQDAFENYLRIKNLIDTGQHAPW